MPDEVNFRFCLRHNVDGSIPICRENPEEGDVLPYEPFIYKGDSWPYFGIFIESEEGFGLYSCLLSPNWATPIS